MVTIRYESISSLELQCTCVGIGIRKWDTLMFNSKKANGSKIRGLIKKHLPELYESLALEFRNPYENQSVRTTTHLIYVHSGIEYFIKYS